MQRIGIWQTAFLGDLVLTLPLINTVRTAYPKARLEVFVRKGLAPVLAGHADAFTIREFDKRGAQRSLAAAWGFGRSLRREPPGPMDAWISTHTSLRSALIAKAVAAPLRVGYNAPAWNRLAYTHTMPREPGGSLSASEETHRLARLAEPLLAPLGMGELEDWPELRPQAEALDRVNAFWRERGLDSVQGSVVGLHPGTLWPTKRWPASHYAAVLDAAVAAGAKVLVFAGPGEEAVARQVLETSRLGRAGLQDGRVVDLAGKLNIVELIAHIWKLSVYVANDSGPMHAAWAMRTPVVALIGPTGSIGFDPRGPTAQVASIPPQELECRPCGTHGAKACKLGHHKCMQDLTPQRVWPLVQKALEMHGGR